MTNPSSDVLIIGGGIVGTSAAFFLRRADLSVTLVEQSRCGQFASGTNYGNLRRQGRPLDQLPLANRAHELWPQLAKLLDQDVECETSGHLRVCYADRPEAEDEFIAYADAAREHGLDLEVLSGRSLKARFPFLGNEVIAGSYSPQDGHANPRLVAPAFARAAVRAGAVIRERTEIQSIGQSSFGFTAQGISGEEFSAQRLLITAGAWGHRLSAQFGETVHLKSRGPTMSVTEPVPFFLRPSVGVFTPVAEESVYCRQIPRGNVIIGGGSRNAASIDTRRSSVEPGHVIGQWGQVLRLVPRLRTATVIRSWSGVEGYTQDGLPVISASPNVKGLFYAFGFCGAGFQLGPGVGSVLAELIASGRSDVPLESFDIGRFAPSADTSREPI